MAHISQEDLLVAIIIAAGAEEIDQNDIRAGALDDAMCFLMEDGTLDANRHSGSRFFAEAQRAARIHLNGYDPLEDNDEEDNDE